MVASVAGFIVLSATAQSGRLDVRQTVAARYRTSYDVLVRPAGSRSTLERREGLVRPSVASQLFGGISLAQWRQVLAVPGVAVAAPIATIGYSLPSPDLRVELSSLLPERGPAAFRIRVERRTDRGLTRQTDASLYVWVTRHALRPPRGATFDPNFKGPQEVEADETQRVVCAAGSALPDGPFAPLARGEALQCWSTRDGLDGRGFASGTGRRVAAFVPASLPYVIAAIDPVQEARLSRLPQAVVRGRYLRAGDRPTRTFVPAVPVLAATRSPADEQTAVAVERLPPAAAAAISRGTLRGGRLRRYLARQPGSFAGRRDFGPRDVHTELLDALEGSFGALPAVTTYWSVRPTGYDRGPGGALVPRVVRNPGAVWASSQPDGFFPAPLSANDRGFRQIVPHEGATAAQLGHVFPLLRSVGRFDPSRVSAGSDGLAAFTVPGLSAADAAGRARLGDATLKPNANIAGYEVQPPALITDLASLPAFAGANFDRSPGGEPISVIRVRVSGVTGIDHLSRERIRRVAELIQTRTGLSVDLTAGSSPSTQTVLLPAGEHGRPALYLHESWIRKGVALAILRAVDRKSVVLLVLLLLVSALTITNATGAAVAARRTELGVLACLGWPRRHRFALVLSEVALVGVAAGVIGSACALAAGRAAGVAVTVPHALLAIAVAVVLAVGAGAVPAVRASRVSPMEAVRPRVGQARRARPVESLAALALVNVLRVPARTLLGAGAVAIGVAATTIVVGVALAFRGSLVTSTLGGVVSLQIRGTDYAAVAGMLALGAFAVADVVHLGLQDRARELATLRSTGWDDAAVGRLARTETLLTAGAGSLAGALAGLAATLILTDQLSSTVALGALGAAGAATTAALVATTVPIELARRQPPLRALVDG